MSSHRPLLRIFSEARLYCTPTGIQAVDPASGNSAWEHYVQTIGDVDLAARVGPGNASATIPLDRIGIHALPYYRGVRQLMIRLPRVIVSLASAVVVPHLCLFRLPGALSMGGAAIARLSGQPYAVEIVGDPREVLESGVLGRPGKLAAPVAAFVMRWLVRGAVAGRYVTTDVLQRRYPVSANVPSHAYSNVSLSLEDLATCARTVTAAPEVVRLMAIGSQDQMYKGHQDLIAAVAILSERGEAVQLTLIGGGQHHAGLQELANKLGVADAVQFMGRLDDRLEINTYLDQADLFCMPSHTEGLPRALIEAMARGVPAIGTRVGGIPELLPNDQMVEPASPPDLAELISTMGHSVERLNVASRAGWERSARFSPRMQHELRGRWTRELRQWIRNYTSAPSRKAISR